MYILLSIPHVMHNLFHFLYRDHTVLLEIKLNEQFVHLFNLSVSHLVQNDLQSLLLEPFGCRVILQHLDDFLILKLSFFLGAII